MKKEKKSPQNSHDITFSSLDMKKNYQTQGSDAYAIYYVHIQKSKN
jgi:hypothetical protein